MLAGYMLTAAEWSALEPRARTQLLAVSLRQDEPWLAHATTHELVGDDLPVATVEPGPDACTVVIHAAAPSRPGVVRAARRAVRTSDVEIEVGSFDDEPALARAAG